MPPSEPVSSRRRPDRPALTYIHTGPRRLLRASASSPLYGLAVLKRRDANRAGMLSGRRREGIADLSGGSALSYRRLNAASPDGVSLAGSRWRRCRRRDSARPVFRSAGREPPHSRSCSYCARPPHSRARWACPQQAATRSESRIRSRSGRLPKSGRRKSTLRGRGMAQISPVVAARSWTASST